MKKLAVSVFVTTVLILLVALTFTLYAQFALDYSMETLRRALEGTQRETPDDIENLALRASLESMIFEEMTREDADLETVTFLEHVSRSIRDALEASGYARAGAYIVEVLNGKSAQRNSILRMTDQIYYFLNRHMRSIQDFCKYLWTRFQSRRSPFPVGPRGILLLSEAERMERSWRLAEAERYYREFINQFPMSGERGFVMVSLGHVLMKRGRLDDADPWLARVQKEFPGGEEEELARGLRSRIRGIRKHQARILELENWVKNVPDEFFKEKGGLELALAYLSTYQVDRALLILEKLGEAPDPRIQAKALFYRGWIHKWKGNLEKGKEIFRLLEEEPDLEEGLQVAAKAQLAEVHYEKQEYEEAANQYRELSLKAVRETWRALAELEQDNIYFFELNRAEEVRGRLERLDELFPKSSPEFQIARARLEEALQRGLRDQGFAALRRGRVNRAFQIFQNYLKQYSQDGIAHSGVASIYVLRGDLEKAVEEAEKGYGLIHDEYTAAVLGFVYEKVGKLEEAAQHNYASSQIKPSYLTARFNLAHVYMKLGRFSEADRLLIDLEKETAELTPTTRAKILNNRGYALWYLGRKKEARDRFREALKVMPELIEAQQNSSLTVSGEPVLA